MKFKIVKLKKIMKETKIPKGYRLAKLWELLRYVAEGYKLKKGYWYYCENYLKDKTLYCALDVDWGSGHGLGVVGYDRGDDGIGFAFGVFVKL